MVLSTGRGICAIFPGQSRHDQHQRIPRFKTTIASPLPFQCPPMAGQPGEGQQDRQLGEENNRRKAVCLISSRSPTLPRNLMKIIRTITITLSLGVANVCPGITPKAISRALAHRAQPQLRLVVIIRKKFFVATGHAQRLWKVTPLRSPRCRHPRTRLRRLGQQQRSLRW